VTARSKASHSFSWRSEADAAAELEALLAKSEDAVWLAEADARDDEDDAEISRLADYYLEQLGLAEKRQTEEDTTMTTTTKTTVLDVIKKGGVTAFAR
jgi:hypothetical protein